MHGELGMRLSGQIHALKELSRPGIAFDFKGAWVFKEVSSNRPDDAARGVEIKVQMSAIPIVLKI
jgi:hypothetical protein